MNIIGINKNTLEAFIAQSSTYPGTQTDIIYIFCPSYAKYLEYNQIPAGDLFRPELKNPWTYWDSATKLDSIRLQRDYLLTQTDWRAIKAVETQTPESQAWINYRQALRDFPNLVNVNLPIEQIIWPQPPS